MVSVVSSDLSSRYGPRRLCEPTGHYSSGFLKGAELCVEELQEKGIASLAPVHLDLLRIARAVFLLDGASRRPETWRRPLSCCVTVDDKHFWDKTEVKTALTELLTYLTGDEWEFQFEKRDVPMTPNLRLSLPPFEKDVIVLLSEGLDSICGVGIRLQDYDGKLMFGVHAVTQLERCVVLKGVLKELAPLAEGHMSWNRFNIRRDIDKLPATEPSQRSKSFLLLTLAAIQACQQNTSRIEVFENGIEAFNFAGAAAFVPGTQSRMMHPVVLHRMSRLLALVCQKNFEIKLPFLFATKNEMISKAKQVLSDQTLLSTVSCLHYSARRMKARQCGVCEACLMRRQALASVGLNDAANYSIDVLCSSTMKNSEMDSLYEYDARITSIKDCLNQVKVGQTKRWNALVAHVGMGLHESTETLQAASSVSDVPVSVVEAETVAVWERYCAEWESFRTRIVALP